MHQLLIIIMLNMYMLYLHQLLIHIKGTNLRRYFDKVAKHHGLQFKVIEYEMAEEPSTNDEATFYVTHMREPVSRSISSFKCKRCCGLYHTNCNNDSQTNISTLYPYAHR